VPARFEVRFEQQEAAAQALRACAIRATPAGLCLRTARTYAVGDEVQLALRVAREGFALSAVVAWVRPAARVIGVRFVELAAADAARLQQLLEGARR
jgi:uncharacterized protein (TIGR02266 family)